MGSVADAIPSPVMVYVPGADRAQVAMHTSIADPSLLARRSPSAAHDQRVCFAYAQLSSPY